MCGIAGILDIEPKKSIHRIKSMLRTMRHRGPNGTAHKRLKNATFGLVRLAMTDTCNPATIFEDSEYSLLCTFNGEIYNYEALKQLLPERGAELQTRNDGEIILHLYKLYGKYFVRLLNGMFVIAITDGKSILLYSDYFGIKPLYYTTLPDGTFVFGSELRSVLTHAPKQTLSEQALSSYFQYRFVAHPLTIFSDINKISPHQILEIRDNKIEKYTYAPDIKPSKTLRNWIKGVHNYESNEVDIGYFLSGGLDSSILSALATKPAHTFTIQYPHTTALDEVNYAKQVAGANGHVHHICQLKDKQVNDIVNKSIVSLEEPLYSTVAPSTYFLAQSAKPFVKGIISGDGADELFIGYHYIRTALNAPHDKIGEYKRQIGWLDDKIAQKIFTKRPDKINLISTKDSPLHTIVAFERNYRLPSYHLFRLDKMTMANSIEGRVPFLSNEVLSFLDGHTTDYLYTENPKEILIKRFKQLLPNDIITRKKQPFPSPFIHWIDTCLYKDILKMFRNYQLCSLMGLDSKQLSLLLLNKNRTYSDYTAIWGVYVLLKWLEHYKRYLI